MLPFATILGNFSEILHPGSFKGFARARYAWATLEVNKLRRARAKAFAAA